MKILIILTSLLFTLPALAEWPASPHPFAPDAIEATQGATSADRQANVQVVLNAIRDAVNYEILISYNNAQNHDKTGLVLRTPHFEGILRIIEKWEAVLQCSE